MREMKNKDNRRATTLLSGLVVLVILGLALAVLFATGPTAWATPEQIPDRQTGPTAIPPQVRPPSEAVPEPATILLLGGGAFGVLIYACLVARRHRQEGGANGSSLSE